MLQTNRFQTSVDLQQAAAQAAGKAADQAAAQAQGSKR